MSCCLLTIAFGRVEDWEIDRICDRTKNERFASHCGFKPATVAAVINDNLQIKRVHLFIAICWWKMYETEHQMNSRWHLHQETLRRIVYNVCNKLAQRKSEKIVFGDFDERQIYLASYDCVHCETEEFGTDPSSKWYSHKHNGPGLTYNVAVDTVRDRIVWAGGPYPAAATHDITIFWGGKVKDGKQNWRKSSMYHKIPEGKRLVADSGLVVDLTKISTTLGGHSAEV